MGVDDDEVNRKTIKTMTIPRAVQGLLVLHGNLDVRTKPETQQRMLGNFTEIRIVSSKLFLTT